MTDPQTPATEAGRRLLDAPDVLLMMNGGDIIGLNEGELELQIIAIEAEARAESSAYLVVDALTNAEKAYKEGRADALREAAEELRRVTVVTTTGVAAVTWIDIEAILDPQP